MREGSELDSASGEERRAGQDSECATRARRRTTSRSQESRIESEPSHPATSARDPPASAALAATRAQQEGCPDCPKRARLRHEWRRRPSALVSSTRSPWQDHPARSGPHSPSRTIPSPPLPIELNHSISSVGPGPRAKSPAYDPPAGASSSCQMRVAAPSPSFLRPLRLLLPPAPGLES